jgi:NADH-quinone oxidoreductase subunit L
LLAHAWIIPLIPAASFLLILFFGKRLPYKGAEIGIGALALSFLAALAVNVRWFRLVDRAHGGEHAVVGPVHRPSRGSPRAACRSRSGCSSTGRP